MADSNQNKFKNIIIALLLIAVVVVGYLMTRQSGEIENLDSEKQALITNLETMRSELLATRSENDSMGIYITSEVERMGFLIKELEGKNNMSAAELDKYKRSAKKYEVEKKRLIGQVDSINKAYQALSVEKAQVEETLQEEVVKNEGLNTENRDLKKNVAVGSMLALSKIDVSTFKVKGAGKEKESNSASSVDRVKACFTVAKNTIAPKGERMVYMRVTTPDLKVLAFQGEDKNSFSFNGQPLIYSAKQAVFYENDIVESCINMDRDADFVKGEYTVELFTEGYKLGEAKFTLK